MSIPATASLQLPKLLLLGIAASLMSLHLTLVWQQDYTNLWMTSLIFWGAISVLVSQQRHQLTLTSGRLASGLGTTILVVVLLKSTSPTLNYLNMFPLLSALGLALLASGFKGLKHYRREFVSLFFFSVPRVAVSPLIDLSPLTAKLATFLLWYLGFDVSRYGVNIILPGGAVSVYSGCSGLATILELLALAVLLLVLFPTRRSHQILVSIGAVFLGFFVNGIRVVVMAIASAANEEAFDYWHTGDGSLIFALIAQLLFGLFCFGLLRLHEARQPTSV